jgi:class 3 adenylate cyclase
VNTGEVLATTESRPGESMVTGDAVNAASRLEAAAAPGQVIASERTVRAVRGFLVQNRAPSSAGPKLLGTAPLLAPDPPRRAR